jgi:hypothetical protein
MSADFMPKPLVRRYVRRMSSEPSALTVQLPSFAVPFSAVPFDQSSLYASSGDTGVAAFNVASASRTPGIPARSSWLTCWRSTSAPPRWNSIGRLCGSAVVTRAVYARPGLPVVEL